MMFSQSIQEEMILVSHPVPTSNAQLYHQSVPLN